jgi:uncharacterized protein YecT (DUF1311 family)
MSVGWRLLTTIVLLFSSGMLCSVADDLDAKQPLSTPPFFKTSFDCAKSRFLSTEEAICKNEQLAKLDLEMAAAYRGRWATTSTSEKAQLVSSQNEWLRFRNSYETNPYHGDPPGVISDIAELYANRISALRSENPATLVTRIPDEYAWLRTIAGTGFSKRFSLGRTYMGCVDPCKKTPSSYRWISIWGSGIGDEPGDIDTPFRAIAKKLAAEGWSECRSADDSQKPIVDYFTKGDRLVEIFRYYSMGVGNSIGVGVTTSGPLHPYVPQEPANPPVDVGNNWETYEMPALGLKLRYPSNWRVRDMSAGSLDTKYVMFGAKDFTADFTFEVRFGQRAEHWPRGINDEGPEVSCSPSPYQISGMRAEQCVISGEQVGDGICRRSIYSEAIKTSNYALRFEPGGATVYETSGTFRLTHLYERILGTIQIQVR